MVFDGPLLKGNFVKRIAILKEELAKNPNDTVKLID